MPRRFARALALLLCAGAGAALAASPPQPAAPAEAQALPAASAGPLPSLLGQGPLDPRQMVHLVVARSAEIRFGRLQVEVQGHLKQAEASLYEAVLFNTLRRESRYRQRSIEERQSSLVASGQSVLDETVRTVEAGVRGRTPSGADLSFAYRQNDKSNNIIAAGTGNKADTEYTGAMVLTLRQPLARGAGRSVVETDLRVAQIEHDIANWQFRQQLLKACSDALSAYWQLHRAREVLQARREAAASARQVVGEASARLKAGRLATTGLAEARSALVVRDAEVERARQALQDAQAKFFSVLNIAELGHSPEPAFMLAGAEYLETLPAAEDASATPPFNAHLEAALDISPAYRIAQLRREQAQQRLAFAKNQRQPNVDLLMSYSTSGLAYERSTARDFAESTQYPDRYVGVNVEIPLGGNQKAKSQFYAQMARVSQSEVEIETVRTALANDLFSRRNQLDSAREEVRQLEEDAALRRELAAAEKIRFERGMSLVTQYLQRVLDYNESRLRLLDANLRLQQARIALQFADGSLLEHYSVSLQ